MFQSHQDGNLDSSPVKGKKKNVNNPLVPVLIRQIHFSNQNPEDEEELYIDGRYVSNVSFIGQITAANQANSSLVYTVDDGTASIDVKMWIDSGDPNQFLLQKSEDWQPGVFVKVVGAMKVFNGKKSITGHNIMPLVDFNQLVYHQLDSILVHVQATGANKGNQPQPQQQYQQNTNQQQNQQNQQNQQQQNDGGGDFGSLHQNVYDFYGQAPTANGRSFTEVYQEFASFASKDKLNEVVQFLVDEGHLYETLDKQHFAVTGESA
jgi:replication factor A2